MQRVRDDDARARLRFLEVLFGRMQHEAATPLLTASGFAHILAGTVAGADATGTADTLGRVTSGIERARRVLAASAALVASHDVHRVDLVALVEEVAVAVRGRGTPVALSLPTHRVHCYAEAGVARELVTSVLGLVAARSPGGAVAVDVGTAGTGTVVLALAGGRPWPSAVVAAVDALPDGPGALDAAAADDDSGALPTGHEDAAGAHEARVVARAAAAAASQLGALWLDPESPGRLTLRLLAAVDDPAAGDDDGPRVVDG